MGSSPEVSAGAGPTGRLMSQSDALKHIMMHNREDAAGAPARRFSPPSQAHG